MNPDNRPAPSAAPLPGRPGDETEPGTPQSAEGICPDCGGTGRLGHDPCPGCQGSGTVAVIVGDA